MKFLIYLAMFIAAVFTCPIHSYSAVGDVNYISDELKVPLRSGPSSGHRIIHRGLPSGTHLTVLAIDEEAGFTQVRTSGGMEGWVRSQYLMSEPIARVKLATAGKRLQDLKDKIKKEREAHASLQTTHKEIKADNQALSAKVEALGKELAELKVVSADPIREHTRNVELTQQNTRLVQQVDELSSKTRRLEENVQLQWLMYGGALVLIGLVLGVIIKTRPRKTASYSRY